MGGPRPAFLREDLEGKIAWFITLRWLAALGLILAVTASRFLFGVTLPLRPLYLGAAALLVYNGLMQLLNRRLRARVDEPDWLDRAYRLASLQVFLDLSLLTYLLFFSGGLENPFVFYYIFHMILSSILLARRSAYLQGTFAVFLFALLIAGHRLGWIPSEWSPLVLRSARAPIGAVGIVGWLVAFASTVYITVYLTSTIVGKLRQREQELEISNSRLAEQDRLKSQYVLTVSHDIQGTLSAIHSLLTTVLGGFAGRIADQPRGLIERASLRSQELLRFVRDLLDISRMRSETGVERRAVCLVEILNNQIELFRAPLAEKRITLELDLAELGGPDSNAAQALRLWADPTAATQLVSNLVSNAIRYTPPGGRVGVSVHPRTDRNLVDVSIADTGIGIPAESLPHIFEDFYRAGNARGFSSTGTGLGLSIVKKIVESHGGDLRVESELGRGTVFTFSLPLGPVAEAGRQVRDRSMGA